MIDVRDVSIAMGRRTIVSGVEFAARPGQITAIVGPNGSGKTTLLKAMSGDLAYAGSITINGREVSAMRQAEQAALRAVLPQSSSLSFPFTVREIVNLGILGGWSGVPAGETARLPERALARVDLDGFAGRLYQELSGGEQQRVQLARVLCQVWSPTHDGAPRYLFLDEPVSSLDIRHQIAILQVARDYATAGGGVVAILHDLNLAAMFADAILVLRDGTVGAYGAPRDILSDRVIEEAFGCRLQVGKTPPPGIPFVLPQSIAS